MKQGRKAVKIMDNSYKEFKALVSDLLDDLVDSDAYDNETIAFKLYKFIVEQNIELYKTYLNCYGHNDKETLEKLEHISKIDTKLNTGKISMGVMYEIYDIYTDDLLNNDMSKLEEMTTK